MLIDATYFRGNINIPGTDPATLQRLAWFIEVHEERFLKSILGLSLYNAFTEGLLEDPVDQVWSDLLYGKQFVAVNGRLYEWKGLIQSPGSILSAGLTGKRTVIVGRGQLYDPAANATSVTIPPEMVGQQFILNQRGFGFLDTDEFTVTGSTLTLTGGRTFSLNDRYYYIPLGITLTSGTGTAKRSMIANYVYYQWTRDQATQTSQVGEVKTKTENASRTDFRQKQSDAWNDMAFQLWQMWEYLDGNKVAYPSYQADYWTRNQYRTINPLNI